MSEIEVEGLGVVEIAGDAPSPEESQAIQTALGGEKFGPPQAPPPTFMEDVGTAFKDRATSGMAGALVGGEIGAKRGPLGLVAGGALGFGAGATGNDVVQEFLGTKPPTTIQEATLTALDDVMTDAQYGAAGVAAGPFLKKLGKPLLGKILGLGGDETKRIVNIAANRGVDLGAINVTKSRLVKGTSRVLGVFPFIGTPFSEGKRRISGQLSSSMADILNTLAPTSTMFDIGKEFTAGAMQRFAAFNRLAASKYSRFEQAAEELPIQDIVSTKPIREFLEESSKKEAVEAIRLSDDAILAPGGADLVGGYLSQLAKLPEKITVRQARGLERQLNEVLTQAGIGGFDVSRLSGVKGALQSAKGSLDLTGVPKEQADKVLRLWKNANDFYHETMKSFETPTAKKFGRVEKKIFKAGIGEKGFKNTDELFRDVVSAKSVDALTDLRHLVGGRRFRLGARKFLENSFEESITTAPKGSTLPDIFDVNKFSKKLNLDSPEGKAIVDEMVKFTDVSRKEFEEFVEVAARATDVSISDPSGFLARRMVLGGGVTGGFLVGAGGSLSISGAALLTLVARKSAKFLNSNTALRDMTLVLDDSVPDQKKRVALLRILKFVEEKDEE